MTRALQDVVVVLESVALACGSTETLDEARTIASTILGSVKRGQRDTGMVNEMIARLIELIDHARAELEMNGCLEAYRLDDALAALESIRLRPSL